jgi:hypothetical protein
MFVLFYTTLLHGYIVRREVEEVLRIVCMHLLPHGAFVLADMLLRF